VTVRLEGLLAAAPQVGPRLFTITEQQQMGWLLIDMGEALRLLEGAMRFEEDAAMFDQEAKPLLARLDRLGNTT